MQNAEPAQKADIALKSDETDHQNEQEILTKTVECGLKTTENLLDTSIDSGIHDVIVNIKQEPLDGNDIVEKTVDVPNTEKLDHIKPEKGDNACKEADKKQLESDNCAVAINVDETQTSNTKSEIVVKEVSKSEKDELNKLEKAARMSDNLQTVNEPLNELDKGTSSLTDQGGSEKMAADGGAIDEGVDADVVIVEGAETETLMDYRSSGKVITIDDTSDSSPDSSDSDDEAEKSKDDGSGNTDAQINKIVSNARDEFPEQERRVKLNRHGFEDIRTKGELLPEDLPPLEELTITVDDSVMMTEVGTIKSIVGILVVIQSSEHIPPLDEDTILFVEGHKVLGQVFETFGPVKTPWYSVRFNQLDNIKAKGLKEGMPVYCAPKEDSFTKYVFLDSLKTIKGSDASWEDNNEPPAKHLDYSDDESERRAKAKSRGKKVGDNDAEAGERESFVQKKNRKNRNRNRANRDDEVCTDGQSQPQPQKRGWNPFQGNQNNNGSNRPPNFGARSQPYINSDQRWPPRSNNFNRPPQRFGGPPDFQQRPRFSQNSDQIRSQNSFTPGNMCGQNNRPAGPFPHQNFACPPQQFGMQSPPPSFTPTGIQSNLNQSQPRASMNMDFSRPPPPPSFQPCNPFSYPNQQSAQNSWTSTQFGGNQQGVPFTATPLRNMSDGAGNQQFGSGLQPGNQMLSQQNWQNQSAGLGNQAGNQILNQNNWQNRAEITGIQSGNQTVNQQNWQNQEAGSRNQMVNKQNWQNQGAVTGNQSVQRMNNPPENQHNTVNQFAFQGSQTGMANSSHVNTNLPANLSQNYKPQGSFSQQGVYVNTDKPTKTVTSNCSNYGNGGTQYQQSNKKTFKVHSLNPVPGEAPNSNVTQDQRKYENIPIGSFNQSYRPQNDAFSQSNGGSYLQNGNVNMAGQNNQTGSSFSGINQTGSALQPMNIQQRSNVQGGGRFQDNLNVANNVPMPSQGGFPNAGFVLGNSGNYPTVRPQFQTGFGPNMHQNANQQFFNPTATSSSYPNIRDPRLIQNENTDMGN